MRDMVVEIARTHWGMGSKIFADLYRPGLATRRPGTSPRCSASPPPPDVAADLPALIYHHDVSALLPVVTAPALVLHYRRDRLIRFAAARTSPPGLPNATLLPLDGRVHLPDAADLEQSSRRSPRTYSGTRVRGRPPDQVRAVSRSTSAVAVVRRAEGTLVMNVSATATRAMMPIVV